MMDDTWGVWGTVFSVIVAVLLFGAAMSVDRNIERIADILEEIHPHCSIETLSDSERERFRELLMDEPEGMR